MKRASDADWAEARRLCRLSASDVRMAKELGMSPRTLIRNRPSHHRRWKAPVHVWVRDLYRERQEKARARAGPAHRDEAGEDEWDLGASDSPAWRMDGEVEEENARSRRRHEQFRIAADALANVFSHSPAVDRVVLFGSVAMPLRWDAARSRRFRRAGAALLHECKDVDLAVWVNDVATLDALRKDVSRTANDLWDLFGIGVAHHQFDVFLLEPGTDRYLGRLCHFGTCPKGKPECLVPGCGAAPFLRQHERFAFDPRSLGEDTAVVLFDRARGIEPPVREAPVDPYSDDAPLLTRPRARIPPEEIRCGRRTCSDSTGGDDPSASGRVQ